MTDVYADLCSDGTLVTSIVGAGDPAVYFGSRRVGLPVEGNSVRAVSLVELHILPPRPNRFAIVAGQNDIAYLVDERQGTVDPIGPCYGRQSVALNTEYAAVVRDAHSYLLNGNVKTLPPDQQGTSIGIADLNLDGSVQWMAEPDPNRPGEMMPRVIVLGPVTLRYYVERKGVYLGLLLNGTEDQVVLVDGDGPHTLSRGLGHEPHLTVMDDGRIGACWRELGKGAGMLIGPPWPPFHDASQDLPPVESVPLLNREFGMAVYCFNDFPAPGDMKCIELPIRPQQTAWFEPVLATTDDHDRVPDSKLWAIYSGESHDLSAEQAILLSRIVGNLRQRGLSIYQDSFPMRRSVYERAEDHDILAPQCYRNAGEPLDTYRARVHREYRELSQRFETWPTVNIHQRFSGTTPTLSVREVVEGFVTACQLAKEQHWSGMHLFRIGTSDCPLDALWPYLERFMSGITGTPPARVLESPEPDPDPIPEEPSMIALGPIIKDTFTAVTEVVLDNGDIAIDLPNGNRKAVTPDGKEEERPPGTSGPWERFKKGANGYIAHREWDGKVTTYVLPFVESR